MSLWEQINTAENSNEAVTNEKHLPVIKAEQISEGKCKISVNVGSGKHPNDMDHFIQWVELRVGGLYIGRAEFSAGIMDPVVDFVVNCKEGSVISAVARCNKHGLWESTLNC